MYAWGDNRRFNSYSGYFRRMFGCRVQKLSVDAGFTCPNRDGTISGGGCTFCNNGAFTPSYCMPVKGVRRQIEEGIEFHRRRYRTASKYLVYFQSFSNTYAPLERLKEVYGEALAHPDVAGIVVGTRPDCVDAEKLDYFAELARGRYVAVEYGIESTRDENSCWRCSKKDWRNEMRIKAKFLYLYSRCDRFGQAAPRQPANLFAIAPCLHYVLDRRRFGKMQVDLLLPSVCTIFAFAIANISVPK